MLAGVVLVVGQAWILWGRAWLDRAYLRVLAAPVIDAERMAYAREGARACIVAHRTQDGESIVLRWSLDHGNPCLHARTSTSPWRRLGEPTLGAVRGWLTTLPR